MKRLLLPLGFLAFTSMAHAAPAQVGLPAPAFTAQDIEGQAHRLDAYRGKIVVLEASNLDCPFCAHHFQTGAMQALQAESVKKGVVWFVVNSSNPKSASHRSRAVAKKEWAQQKMKATAWLDDSDGKVGKAYDLKTTPHMIVIDQKGVVAYDGAIDDKPDTDIDPRTARNYVREAIDHLLAGKPVTVAKTKPYGCGIKYAE